MDEDVPVGECEAVGVLQALCTVSLEFKTPDDSDGRYCFKGPPETAVDRPPGITTNVHVLPSEQVQVNRRASFLAGRCECGQICREHVELALGPETPRTFCHSSG